MSLICTNIINIVKHLDVYASDSDIKSCIPMKNNSGNLWAKQGGQSYVVKVKKNNREYAFRINFEQLSNEMMQRYDMLSKYLAANTLKYFIPFRFYPNSITYQGIKYSPILMDWVVTTNLKKHIKSHLQDKKAIKKLIEDFLNLVEYLHSKRISHGDLHHNNIRVTQNGDLVLLDYDSVYILGMEKFRDECKGYKGYQHPFHREKNEFLSHKIDYYSELVIYISLKAIYECPSIWDEYDLENREDALTFDASDYADIDNSKLFKHISSLSPELQKLCEILRIYLNAEYLNSLMPLEEVLKSIVGKRFCIICGRELEHDEKYCIMCGTQRID